MKTVNEVSKMTGISVRTLHYYDEIGLLHPAQVQDSGYRLYDDENIKRLQQIMMYRELEFPLKEIKRIIDSPNFEAEHALSNQIELLTLRRNHLDKLILHAEEMRIKEEAKMNFDAYKDLAKKTWGDTDAYKEYEEKSAKQTDTEKRQAAEDLMNIFFEFGEMKTLDPADDTVQAQVKKLQDFITEKYYTCTKQILKGLGKMYIAGGDMTTNIDVAGGKGTAEFASKAIEIYCK